MCIRDRLSSPEWISTTNFFPDAWRNACSRMKNPLSNRETSLSLIHISEPTRPTPLSSSAASDVYKRQVILPGVDQHDEFLPRCLEKCLQQNEKSPEQP